MIKNNPLVMIPGPTPVVRSIQDQMGRDTAAFNDPYFIKDFKKLVDDLTAMWNCDGTTFITAGSGTLAMEMAIANITQKGDKVLLCSNGFFGDRYIEICERKGLALDLIQAEWGTSVTPEQIDKQLTQKKADVLIVTHVETSTGVEIDLPGVMKVMREKHPDVLVIVDGVAAVAGARSYSDWGIDILFTCTQKAFGVAPGLAMLWASKRAIEKRRSMPTISESYIDFEKWLPVMQDTAKYWGTPAVNLIWALAESVRLIKEEGLETRYDRHCVCANAVREGLKAIGFEAGAEKDVAACTLSVFLYPEGSNIDDVKFRNTLYDEGVHVAGCLGKFAGKGFRLGHMGNIDKHTLVSTLAAIERACAKCGMNIEFGTSIAALQKAFVAM